MSTLNAMYCIQNITVFKTVIRFFVKCTFIFKFKFIFTNLSLNSNSTVPMAKGHICKQNLVHRHFLIEVKFNFIYGTFKSSRTVLERPNA